MRIPVREGLFIGQDRCPEFEPCREPLPKKLEVLLCLVDGAEQRRKLQAKLNAVETTADTGAEGESNGDDTQTSG
jgi:NADH:ubiquinone oxidoreductase subunit F (NADH-binding)